MKKSSIRKTWNVISSILVALVVLLALLLVGARLFGLQVYTVLSGSMEPTYHTGSLIYVKKVDPYTIRDGQVITFMLDENTIATHRVVGVVPDEEDSTVVRFRTKGDANETEDGGLVHYKNVIGTPVFTIPYLGFVANYIQHPPGMYVAISAGAVLLLLTFLPDLFAPDSKDETVGEDEKNGPIPPRAVTSAKDEGNAARLPIESFNLGGFRNMKTKSKALLLTLCAVLLVAASVLGTMAYLTSTDTVTNTFTVGKVEIKLDETDVTNPNGPRVTANSYKLMPGTTYTKDPTVTVKAGSEASYVRMKVTFNNATKIIALCTDPEFADEVTGVENAFPLIRMVKFVEANAAKWDGIIPDNMVETEDMLADAKYFAYDKTADTLTYIFYYRETVTAPTADVVLPVLFDSITVPEWVTGEQLKALNDFRITVIAEAIQAGSFDNAADAWSHF